MEDQLSRIATSKHVSRRNFLLGTGAGIVGVGVASLCPRGMALALPPVVPYGWGSFLKGLFRFAKKVGMTALGITLNHYLNKLDPGIRYEINGSLSGIGGAGYGVQGSEAGQVMAGETSFFTPLVNPENVRKGLTDKAALVPFYDISPTPASRVGSVLSTPTMSAMPFVAEDLERLGFSTDERHGLLVPTRARQNSYNTENLPDTYITRGGSVEANYRAYDALSGDLRVRVTRKRDGKSERLEPVLEGTYGVHIAA
ncbi:MAG: hypothetical protein QOC99_3378 [Acidobacteriota bacterium]|nr:hypothetical protein [Acidobacteriota bacterium]